MNVRTFGVSVLLLLDGCASERSGEAAVEIFNPHLAAAFESYAEPMLAPPASTRFDTTRADAGCPDSLQARTGNQTTNWVCAALDVLSNAHPLRPAKRPPSFYTDAIINRLDLRSFPSSLQPRMEEDALPLLGALPFVTPIGVEYSVISDREDWFYSFEVLARADMDGDGTEDWLVLVTDESREGSYRAYGLLVLEDAVTAGRIRAKPLR